MTEETKREVLEQLELDIKFGFENEEQLFSSIKDMFFEEEYIDEHWLKQVISTKYKEHQLNSYSWTQPTDFQKLADVFDELIKEGIVCLHNAGYTKSDGEGDCLEVIERLNELGAKAVGYCYYHSQDLGRAVDPTERNLLLGFDSPTQRDSEALFVANKIVDALKRKGFDVVWPGTVDCRIEIINIDWKKTPDDQKWDGERVFDLLTQRNSRKKPFWKFW